MMIPASRRISLIALAVLAAAPAASATLAPQQELGKLLYFDQRLSKNRNQACASCHQPGSGFADPANAADPARAVTSRGSDPQLSGGRNAPSAAYAAFSPRFRWNAEEALYVGGQFWDGRAAGLREQAKGPFLNPLEMAMPDARAVIEALRAPDHPAAGRYAELFRNVYRTELTTARLDDPLVVDGLYDQVAAAIASYEASPELNAFSSKYDRVLAGKARLSAKEKLGLRLFNGKAKCSQCHPSKPGRAPDGSPLPPLFTDFTYDNLGIPRSRDPQLAAAAPDLGLGGRPEIAAADPQGAQRGKFKVPTLRNVALTAPYGHNGYFATLADIVEFYNSAGVPGRWPAPEVAASVNRTEMGRLRLRRHEVAAIVAFMETLTDGYAPSPFSVTVPLQP